MGYAAMTSGLHNATASAAAKAISIPILSDITYPSSVFYHLYGTGPALVVANATALAVIKICHEESVSVFRNTRLRTE
jgi:hypothetical protein